MKELGFPRMTNLFAIVKVLLCSYLINRFSLYRQVALLHHLFLIRRYWFWFRDY